MMNKIKKLIRKSRDSRRGKADAISDSQSMREIQIAEPPPLMPNNKSTSRPKSLEEESIHNYQEIVYCDPTPKPSPEPLRAAERSLPSLPSSSDEEQDSCSNLSGYENAKDILSTKAEQTYGSRSKIPSAEVSASRSVGVGAQHVRSNTQSGANSEKLMDAFESHDSSNFDATVRRKPHKKGTPSLATVDSGLDSLAESIGGMHRLHQHMQVNPASPYVVQHIQNYTVNNYYTTPNSAVARRTDDQDDGNGYVDTHTPYSERMVGSDSDYALFRETVVRKHATVHCDTFDNADETYEEVEKLAKPPSTVADKVEHQLSALPAQDDSLQIPHSSLSSCSVATTAQSIDNQMVKVNPKPKTDQPGIQIVRSPNQLRHRTPTTSDYELDIQGDGIVGGSDCTTDISNTAANTLRITTGITDVTVTDTSMHSRCHNLVSPASTAEFRSPGGDAELSGSLTSTPLRTQAEKSEDVPVFEIEPAIEEDIPLTVHEAETGSADRFETIYNWGLRDIVGKLRRDPSHKTSVDVAKLSNSDRTFLASKLCDRPFSIWAQEGQRLTFFSEPLQTNVRGEIEHYFRSNSPPLTCSFKSPILQAVHLCNRSPAKYHQFCVELNRISSSCASGQPLMYKDDYGWKLALTTAAHLWRDVYAKVYPAGKNAHAATQEGSRNLTKNLATEINFGQAKLYVKQAVEGAAVFPVHSPVLCQYSSNSQGDCWSYDSLFARAEFPAYLLEQPDKLKELTYQNEPGSAVSCTKLEVRGILPITTLDDLELLQKEGILVYCGCANLTKGRIVCGPGLQFRDGTCFDDNSYITAEFEDSAYNGWSGGSVFVLTDEANVLMLVGHVISKVTYPKDMIIEGSTQHVELVQIQPLWPFILKLKRLYPNHFKEDIITVYEYLHRLKLERQKTVSQSDSHDSGLGISISSADNQLTSA